MTKKLRELTLAEVEINFTALREDVPIHGNAIDSGDRNFDVSVEAEISARLGNGDISAWFTAKVTASWNDFEGVDYLGCCSYDSLTSFLNEDVPEGVGSYYTDMKNEALEDLNRALAEAFLENPDDPDLDDLVTDEDKPKVLIAYWHDTVGATPNNEIVALDGDLAGLVATIEYSWLAGSALTDEQIADVKRDLMGGVGADIPTPPDAIGALAQITIDTYDFDDPDIQYLYEED